MVDYNPKNWLTLIFTLHKSSLMRYLLPNLIGLGIYTAILAYVFSEHLELIIPGGVSIHGYVGIVLGLVLVFRTNTAYDRWWEGRKLLGALTNHSRNMAIKVNAILANDDLENRKFFLKTIPNFYLAVKEHLRNGVDSDELDLEGMPYLKAIKAAKHVPNMLTNEIQTRFNVLLRSGMITGDQFRVLNREAEGMVDVLGGCERIRTTPIPYSYSVYIKKVIFLYLLTLPFSLINVLGYWTIGMVMFECYVLAGLELMGEEIEDPFGYDFNDLDTDGMAKNIRKNVREIISMSDEMVVKAAS
ncbi:MAG TPA: hypothetical protein ENJ82_04575 [Bacteroidetes bacterium]|nr:hypothetical protein [Bacteroidota bacterium]